MLIVLVPPLAAIVAAAEVQVTVTGPSVVGVQTNSCPSRWSNSSRGMASLTVAVPTASWRCS